MTSNQTGNQLAIDVNYTTGSCTFSDLVDSDSTRSTHSSLAMCSKCINTTPLTNVQNATVTNNNSVYLNQPMPRYTMPNGIQIIPDFAAIFPVDRLIVQPTSNLTWASDLVDRDMMAVSTWSHANVTVFSPRAKEANVSYPDFDFDAATCTLFPCVRSF